MEQKTIPRQNFLTPETGLSMGLDKELIWAWNQLVLQARFSHTPAGFSDEAEQEQAFRQWEEACIAYHTDHAYSFAVSAFPVPDRFAGRSRELEQLHQLFTDKGRHTKVVLHGMGGIGKTTLALQYAQHFQQEYDAVIFLSYHTNLLVTICDDTQLPINHLSWHPDRFKRQADYFKEKWTILCQLLSKQHVLLILDDMNRFKDRKLPLLWKLPCDVLVTSRIFDIRWNVSSIELQSLDSKQDWTTFYEIYRPEGLTPIQTQNLNRYRQLIQGNTLLMRLAVCNPELCNTVNTSLESYFLRTNSLNSTDIQALRYLSLLPVSGMEKYCFLSASGLRETILEKLIQMSLVWRQTKNGLVSYGLHPVIAESVFHYYKPTPENCRAFLQGVGLQYANIWNSPFTEVSKAVPIYLSLLSHWHRPRAWLADTYDSFATVLWIGGYFEESLKYMMALYQECISYYGEIHQVTGSIALRVAAVYHNCLRFEEAWAWTERALDILHASTPYNILYDLRLAQAAHRQCRNKRHQGLFDEALHYGRESEQAMERYFQANPSAPDSDLSKIYFIWLEKAKILCDYQQYKEADALCRKIRKKYLTSDFEKYHFPVEVDILRAEIQLKQGKPEKAIRLIEPCLATTQTMRGTVSKETLSYKELLADAYAALGRQEVAILLYHETAVTLGEYYPLQKKWYQIIKEKKNALL